MRVIGIMTKRNACKGKLVLFLVALVVLAGFQPGLAENQDIEQFRQAAEQGDAEAQNALGRAYAEGQGVAEDDREAVKWYRKAAKQGHPKAQFRLGTAYGFGYGVRENYRKARKWYRKAAEQDPAQAQLSLGKVYDDDEDGVPKDYVKAYAWYILAAAQGNKEASELKDSLREKMTAAQLTAAQDLAAEFREHIESSKSESPPTSDNIGICQLLHAGDEDDNPLTVPTRTGGYLAGHGNPRTAQRA